MSDTSQPTITRSEYLQKQSLPSSVITFRFPLFCVIFDKFVVVFLFCKFSYFWFNVLLSREESEVTEASASDQDDGEPVPGDTTDLFPAVSSTAFAPPKGPSGNST
ncbi:hypothetical protein XENORESO_018564 [Xenotaenia resolanae]|uniref:Uncharacterized protein n=1 Tax=Xenotaenia resolanae TaxID=208358 RepID=A0ABV0WLC0_9TELE